MGKQRLARNPFVVLSELVNECRCNSGGLLQVIFEDVVVGVHVRVSSPGVVALHVVSNPLEGRQAYFIKRYMIRGPDVSDRQCRSAEIPAGIEQLAENRTGCLITLQVEPTNTPGTVVEIEIGVELFIFRLELVAPTTGLVLRSADSPSEVGGHVC